MSVGTRRMWARRVLRAGWLLAPVLQAPGWVTKNFLKILSWPFTENVYVRGTYDPREYEEVFSLGQTCMLMFIAMFLAGVYFMLHALFHSTQNATPAEITTALKNNPCVIQKFADAKPPVSWSQLDHMGDACESEAADAKSAAEQQKALQKLKATP